MRGKKNKSFNRGLRMQKRERLVFAASSSACAVQAAGGNFGNNKKKGINKSSALSHEG